MQFFIRTVESKQQQTAPSMLLAVFCHLCITEFFHCARVSASPTSSHRISPAISSSQWLSCSATRWQRTLSTSCLVKLRFQSSFARTASGNVEKAEHGRLRGGGRGGGSSESGESSSSSGSGRLVLTHSTHIAGLVPVLRRLAAAPGVATVVPGRLYISGGGGGGGSGGGGAAPAVRVTVPTGRGFKLLARRGTQTQASRAHLGVSGWPRPIPRRVARRRCSCAAVDLPLPDHERSRGGARSCVGPPGRALALQADRLDRWNQPIRGSGLPTVGLGRSVVRGGDCSFSPPPPPVRACSRACGLAVRPGGAGGVCCHGAGARRRGGRPPRRPGAMTPSAPLWSDESRRLPPAWTGLCPRPPAPRARSVHKSHGPFLSACAVRLLRPGRLAVRDRPHRPRHGRHPATRCAERLATLCLALHKRRFFITHAHTHSNSHARTHARSLSLSLARSPGEIPAVRGRASSQAPR